MPISIHKSANDMLMILGEVRVWPMDDVSFNQKIGSFIEHNPEIQWLHIDILWGGFAKTLVTVSFPLR